jgi:hypothetical protein
LARTSGSLGFPCPNCGRDYGSKELTIQEYQKRRKSEGQKSDYGIQVRIRPNLKPVEYAWKNQIEKQVMIEQAIRNLKRVKEVLNSLPQPKRQKLEKKLAAVIGKQPSNLEYYKRKEFDVNEEDKEGKTVGKWNPIERISLYREKGDPLYPWIANPPFETFSKVLAKHSYILKEYYTPKERSLMKKGYNVVMKYRESINNASWRYTWSEWFIIAEYANKESARKAARMLKALDGDIGTISSRYLKRRIKSILKFKAEFIKYLPCFFKFLGIIIRIIENDPELKDEWTLILKKRGIARENYEKRIREEYLKKTEITPNPQSSSETICQYNENEDNNSHNAVVMDNGIIEAQNELIRIYHSTSKGIVKCGPFPLSKLPPKAIEELRKEGKIRNYD